ncbi:MAG: hypothetical protein J6J16_07350 [Lachnospiraceae bacterium]|nr:hypothetical protein [Lachnospiraceae bacterium]
MKNVILGYCKENNVEDLHLFIRDITLNFTDFDAVLIVLRFVIKSNLFLGCKEYIKIKNVYALWGDENKTILKEKIFDIADNTIRTKIDESLKSNEFNKVCDAIIALYTIGEFDGCKDFFLKNQNVGKYIYKVVHECEFDSFLAEYVYDVILFVFSASKELDDYYSGKCIRAIKLNNQSIGLFWSKKKEHILELLKWYFEKEKYISLHALIKILEGATVIDGPDMYKTYEYLDVSKEEFLEKTFSNATVRALDFYFIAKYKQEIPSLDELKHILELNSSSSVFCVVHQCLLKIREVGGIDANIEEILTFIKNKIKAGELYFDATDEYIDGGIVNGILDYNIQDVFQMLCKKEGDVKSFLWMVSYFNCFQNGNLRLNYTKIRVDKVRKSDWKQEYNYICKRYDKKSDIIYIVMNTYLRFFVNLEELLINYLDNLREFWFLGQITTRGDINFLRASKDYELDKKYTIKIYESQNDIKEKPEEMREVRFRIASVDFNSNIIYAKDIETIPEAFSEHIYNKIHALLLSGDILSAYYYLKSFEKTGHNLYSHNEYVKIIRRTSKNHSVICDVFKYCDEEYRKYLQYIYLNSDVRGFVPIENVYECFEIGTSFLGNINLKDNLYFEKSDCYFISPNFWNPSRKLFWIKKENLSKEFACFINGQLKDKHDIRVIFYPKPSEKDLSLELDKVNLHCKEEVLDLPSAAKLFYTKIYKGNTEGNKKNIIMNYIRTYNKCVENEVIEYSDEWIKFFEIYLMYLYSEIFNTYCNYSQNIRKWIWFDNRLNKTSYNKNNYFFILQNELLDRLRVSEELKHFIQSDINYIKIMDALKAFEEIRPIVYDMTIFNLLFDSKEDFLHSFDY